MSAKVCLKCKILKPLVEFHRSSTIKSGHIARCKECIRLRHQEYYKRPGVKERVAENRRKYRKNPEYRKKEYQYSIKYQANRRKSDLVFKIGNNLRTRIGNFIRKKEFNKTNKTLDWLGCSFNEFKKYLEERFQEGMTWDNYGIHGWHVDHIIPLSTAKTEEDLPKLFHYTNLQPLWAIDNIKKGASIG